MNSMQERSAKTIGIIGGMGRSATVDLMRRIIDFTPAKDDIDHIRMLIDNNPKVPSRIEALIDGTGESPASCLVEMALGLQQQGADFLAMPCNTAHHYYAEIAGSVDIPILNMVNLAANNIVEVQGHIENVGEIVST